LSGCRGKEPAELVGWLLEGPVLAADYCECELTKIADIKRRVVEMEKSE